jgi:hypothetical protein
MRFWPLAEAAAPALGRVQMNSFAAGPDLPRHAEPAKRLKERRAESIGK